MFCFIKGNESDDGAKVFWMAYEKGFDNSPYDVLKTLSVRVQDFNYCMGCLCCPECINADNENGISRANERLKAVILYYIRVDLLKSNDVDFVLEVNEMAQLEKAPLLTGQKSPPFNTIGARGLKQILQSKEKICVHGSFV